MLKGKKKKKSPNERDRVQKKTMAIKKAIKKQKRKKISKISLLQGKIIILEIIPEIRKEGVKTCKRYFVQEEVTNSGYSTEYLDTHQKFKVS